MDEVRKAMFECNNKKSSGTSGFCTTMFVIVGPFTRMIDKNLLEIPFFCQ